MCPPGRSQRLAAGKTSFNEMNDVSTVARSISSGNLSTYRTFVRSMTTTRSSCRSFHASWP